MTGERFALARHALVVLDPASRPLRHSSDDRRL
jgi:hypothetical protein